MPEVVNEHDWMAKLDWTMHGDKGRRFSNERQFLAVTLERIAQLATGVWVDEPRFFLATAGWTPVGGFLHSDIVFDPTGKRTSLYETAIDAALRHADELLIPLASRGAVTRDEWIAIEDEGDWRWSCGAGARLVWSQLAPIFAELARTKRIRTWIDPIDGGPGSEPLPPEAWRLPPDAAVRRCARCAVNRDDPFDAEARATHHVFVDPVDLEDAIKGAAIANYIAHVQPDQQLQRLVEEERFSERLLRDHLAEEIRASTGVLSREEMSELLEKRFLCPIPERKLTRILDAALAGDSDLRKLYSKPGPRPKRR